MRERTLIVICGPTAVGKTSMAIKLAQHFDTEIISADSRQFYREMSIGTAKPSPEELAAARHHFIDSHSIMDDYSVGDYERDAIALIEKLFKTREKVILAGGSGLFIDAVCHGFDALPEVDADIRKRINREYAEQGIQYIQDRLREADPVYYAQVDLQNPQRLIRALEVFQATGKPFSSFRKQQIKMRSFNHIKIGLNLDREQLYKRINARVDEMVTAGLLDEVRCLLPHRNRNPLNTVGYSELFTYLEGHTSLDRAIDAIKQNSRHYAKRQITWFKRYPDMKWFSPDDVNEVITYLDSQQETRRD